MTLLDFENQIVNAAIASSICDIPRVVRLSSTAIKLRVEIITGDFIDAFYNEETNTTAYALIRQGQRVFGADNTGGWHLHPFIDPNRHEHISGSLSFVEFVAEIERQYSQDVGK